MLALALQISANHLQITYYMGIILVGIAIAAAVEAAAVVETTGEEVEVESPAAAAGAGEDAEAALMERTAVLVADGPLW